MNIANCVDSYDARRTLELVHEENKYVRKSKLQSLIHEFELLTLDEDKSIASFHAKLRDISNQASLVRDLFDEYVLVWKIT